MTHYKEIDHGFEYGSAAIMRVCHDEKKGWVCVGVKTPRHKGQGVSIYVTKTGKVRIFDDAGTELCGPKPKARRRRAR